MFFRRGLAVRSRQIGRILQLFAALAVVIVAGAGPVVAEKPTANKDALPLETLVQHSGKTEKVEFSWGWIRWVMNGQLDPNAEMTFGIVHVEAGQTNPVHLHKNCEEILYVVSGSCEHKIGEKTVLLKAGDVMRIPRGVPHSARTFEKEPMRAIIVYNTGERDFTIVKD